MGMNQKKIGFIVRVCGSLKSTNLMRFWKKRTKIWFVLVQRCLGSLGKAPSHLEDKIPLTLLYTPKTVWWNLDYGDPIWIMEIRFVHLLEQWKEIEQWFMLGNLTQGFAHQEARFGRHNAISPNLMFNATLEVWAEVQRLVSGAAGETDCLMEAVCCCRSEVLASLGSEVEVFLWLWGAVEVDLRWKISPINKKNQLPQSPLSHVFGRLTCQSIVSLV